MKTISVLLAIAESLTTKAVATLLQANHYVVQNCNSPTQEVAACLAQNPPNFIFVEQISATEASLKKQSPNTEFVLFKNAISTEEARQALFAGFNGCLLHRDKPEDILDGLQKIGNGTPYLSPHIRKELLANLPPNFKTATPLTSCETNVLRLIAQHYSNKEMAQYLKISLWTVQDHRRNIRQKLGLRGGKHILEQYALFHVLKPYLPPPV